MRGTEVPRLIARRAVAACSSWPDAKGWLLTAGILAGLATISLPLGFGIGFLRIDLFVSWQTAVVVAAVAFFSPAVVEELIFRVALLPHPHERAPAAVARLWGTVALALFVIAHPLRTLILSSARGATFADPRFFVLAALLGLACTLAYLRTGSLWPPVVIHWVVATGWLLVFRGYRKLYVS
jgi:predicted Abi (CAAX) family protease